ncbi:MAG: GLUG motif-containing protein [Candidatus Moranbacteria bacterium]|nr:GLUG motif-containing protein [Candidatus Moranbacteria bacterium]
MKIKIIAGSLSILATIFVGQNALAFSGDGDGLSAGSAYQITTCDQLQEMNDDLSGYYILNNNIDCSATANWNSGAGFEPIGDFSNRFIGFLDGQNNTVSDLYINRTTDTGENGGGVHVGLFAIVDEGSAVNNLNLENVDITGWEYVGALAGSLSGTVENVSASGTVDGIYTTTGGLVGAHVAPASLHNSSPLVYTWNGEKYTYVADVGNMLPRDLNGLDLAQIDSWNLVPKADKYSMKISEEYNEIVYYDELALMTFDHAPGYTVVEPLNRTAGMDELRTVSDTPTNPLVSCTDKFGNDCLDSLKDYDDKWSHKDASFVNEWVLDFGDLSAKDNVQLLMRGARDYAANSSGLYDSLRTVQVKDGSGNWVEIYNKKDLGSDGTPRLRSIDLTGKFLSDNYQVKVGFDTLNMNYFAVDTTPQVPFTMNTYHPMKADLQFRGFTAMDKTYYNNHDYDTVSSVPEDLFKNQFGNFTKYGEVNSLLSSTNDQFVVMRYGDHMDIEFPYVAPAEGTERSFILYNEALYKHATNDDIGALGQTTDVLPFQGMTEYSQNTGKDYPMTSENQTYLDEWNTRIYAGKITNGGSTIIDSHASVNVGGDSGNKGGLVGYNTKLITGSYATGDVSGNWAVGGLVGENQAGSQIENCYATGNVTATGNAGGLIGQNYSAGVVSNSYATGNVTGEGERLGGFIGFNSYAGLVSNSYSTGDVVSINNSNAVGGFIGQNHFNSPIDNVFWNNSNDNAELSCVGGTISGGQYNPAISGDKIIWQDYRNGNYDIYLYNLTTQTETRITTDSSHQYEPAISGDKIIWQDYRNGNADIYLYNLTTQTETQITTNGSTQSSPAISGDKIIWQDYRNSNNSDIYLYDLATQTETQITTNGSYLSSPAISGDKIVWQDYRSGNWDIYLYNLTTQTETRITTNSSEQSSPAISGDKIIWQDYRNGNYDIYLYNLTTQTETRITTDSSQQYEPAISGDKIVWYDNRNGSADIYLYNLTTQTETQITTDSSEQAYPAISGDKIVWQDNRNNGSNIYLYDLYTQNESQVVVPEYDCTGISDLSYFKNNSTNQPLASWDFEDIWKTSTALNNGFPRLLWENDPINEGVYAEKFLQDIQAGFISVGGNNPTDTSAITFNVDYTIIAGTAQVVLPAGTIMTKTGGGTIDFTTMDFEDISAALQSASSTTIAGAVSIGIPGFNLSFSQNITVTIPVDASLNGQTLNIYFQNADQTDWTSGLTCTVAEGLCVFQTNHATKYSAGDEPTDIVDEIIEEEAQQAKITSWKAYPYAKPDLKCDERLRVEIKGKHFAKNAEVKIGNTEAFEVNRKSSKKITAKFCMEKLLDNQASRKRTLSVINPDADTEKADKKINLETIITPTTDNTTQTNQTTKDIQQKLVNLGFLDAQYVTGIYGPLTTEAVKKFQADNGIEQVGTVGPLTRAKLEEKGQ